jgi:predicted porin
MDPARHDRPIDRGAAAHESGFPGVRPRSAGERRTSISSPQPTPQEICIMKNHSLHRRIAFRLSAGAVAAALSCGASAVTLAGAEVSMSGRVVAGYDTTNNVAKPDGTSGTASRAASNQWGTSMLTINAQRTFTTGDMGYATLETGFGSDKGGSNDGNLWSRRAFVGLKSTWGKLQFGKNLSISNAVWNIDPMGQQWSSTDTLVGGRNWNLAPGAIEYATPDFGGAGVAFQYSPGGKVGDTKTGSKFGLDASYNGGPLSLHLVYDTAACGDGQTSCTSGKYDNIYNASKEIILGGTYQFGPAKLFAGWNGLSAPDANGITAPKRAHQYWAGVNYQATAPLLLRAAVYTGGSDIDVAVRPFDGASPYGGKKGTLVTLGADYAIEKQMMLWATVAFMKNGSNSRFSSENYWDTVPLAGKNQHTLNFGFVFSF